MLEEAPKTNAEAARCALRAAKGNSLNEFHSEETQADDVAEFPRCAGSRGIN